MLLGAIGYAAVTGRLDLAPERHADGAGPLRGPGHWAIGFPDKTGEWSVGIALCLTDNAQPAVLDGTVFAVKAAGSGYRFLGAYTLVERSTGLRIGFGGDVEGFPPPAPFSQVQPVKHARVTGSCSQPGEYAMSLILGFAHDDVTQAGGWEGIGVGYWEGWRHHVLLVDAAFVMCGPEPDGRYCA